MNRVVRCAHCREQIEDEPVIRRGKPYCSEACAFEATQRPRPTICGHDNGAAAAIRSKK